MLDPRVRLLTVADALDLHSQRRLQSLLSAAVDDHSRELVIDLRGVTALDSSLLAVLVHTDQQFRPQKRAIACVTRPGPVEDLLDATGLRETLQLFAAPEQAAAYLVAGREQRAR